MKSMPIEDVVKVVDGKWLYGRNHDFKSMEITSVSVNSKEVKEGALFVPIKGERYDAHDFISSAFEQGAYATLTEREVEEAEGKACIMVKDTKKALQSLAAYHRSLFSIPIIGVTGSVGKTSTKEMLAAALQTGKRVLKTKGNLNSQIGVALMMFELDREHELAIIEMGISERNEMAALAKMVKPESAVLTNIGVSHIGNLKSKVNIRKEKCHVMDYFPDGGSLFVCGDDEWLRDLAEGGNCEGLDLEEKTKERLASARVVPYGTNETCQYIAKHIRYEEGKTRFTLEAEGKTEEVELGVLGLHHVHNALAAFAVADRYGIGRGDVKRGLMEFEPMKMRGEMIVSNGIRILDDTYNASPDSMKSGLQVLFSHPCSGRRYAVLADVLELGERSEECHREVGRHIVKLYEEGVRLYELVTVGKQARYIAEEVRKGADGVLVRTFGENGEAAEYLGNTLKEGDLVWIKGSRGMHMDEIVKRLNAK